MTLIKAQASLPFLILICLCYLFFPVWQLVYPHHSHEVAFYGWLYLGGFSLLLRFLLVKVEPSASAGCEEIKFSHFSGNNKIIIFLLCIFAILQIWFLHLPILSGPDEPVHVSEQLNAFRSLQSNATYQLCMFLITTFLVFLLLSVVVLTPSRKISFKFSPGNQLNTSFFIVIASLTLLYFFIYHNLYYGEKLEYVWGRDDRWPPLGMVLGIISYSIFGLSEWSGRLVSLFFYLGTGYLVFRLVADETNSKNGLIGALICLGSPIFFTYGHLNYREVGGAFFVTLGVYYLTKYFHKQTLQYIILCFFCIAAGYLFRRTSLILVFVVPVFLLYDIFRRIQWGENTKQIFSLLLFELLLAFICFLAIYPWMHFTTSIRPYKLYLYNFINLEIVLAYLKILPSMVSWPICVLSLLGVVISIRRKYMTGVIAIVFFFIIYILYTGDDPYWIPVERFTVLMVPPVAILSAFATFEIFKIFRYLRPVFYMFVFCGLGMWHFDYTPLVFFPPHTSTFSSYPHFPFDKLVNEYEKSNIPKGNILYPVYWQAASKAYYLLNDIDDYRDKRPKWKGSKERSKTIEELANECDHYNCKALVLALEQQGDQTKVKWLVDLKGEQVLSNQTPFFTVNSVFFHRKKGLALLVPQN